MRRTALAIRTLLALAGAIAICVAIGPYAPAWSQDSFASEPADPSDFKLENIPPASWQDPNHIRTYSEIGFVERHTNGLSNQPSHDPDSIETSIGSFYESKKITRLSAEWQNSLHVLMYREMSSADDPAAAFSAEDDPFLCEAVVKAILRKYPPTRGNVESYARRGLHSIPLPKCAWEQPPGVGRQQWVSARKIMDAAKQKGSGHYSASEMPIKIYFQRENDGSDRSYRLITLGAFDQWVRASDGLISYIEVADRNSANIVVSWRELDLKSDAIKDKPDKYILGYVHNDTNADGIISHSQVMLHTRFGQLPQAVALHELGHALGLMHTDWPGSTMLPAKSSDFRELSDNDCRLLQFLYKRTKPLMATTGSSDPCSKQTAVGSQ